MKPIIREHNFLTGEISDKELNSKQLKIWEAEQEKHLQILSSLEEKSATKEAAKKSALDKLAALGLSPEEISAITGA